MSFVFQPGFVIFIPGVIIIVRVGFILIFFIRLADGTRADAGAVGAANRYFKIGISLNYLYRTAFLEV